MGYSSLFTLYKTLDTGAGLAGGEVKTRKLKYDSDEQSSIDPKGYIKNGYVLIMSFSHYNHHFFSKHYEHSYLHGFAQVQNCLF